MIREFQKADLDRVAEIWLNGNLEAHFFIAEEYWKDHFDMVKEMLRSAEIYAFEEEEEILGFIGLNENHIEGIFVDAEERSRGIGRQLLNYAKDVKGSLSLNVYAKNERAMRFYLREGFVIRKKSVDPDTGEQEYKMMTIFP